MSGRGGSTSEPIFERICRFARAMTASVSGARRLRRSLYAAALPAAFRWNKALIKLYSRLTNLGKKHKAALIACARKLLIYANTVVQRGSPWTEDHAKA